MRNQAVITVFLLFLCYSTVTFAKPTTSSASGLTSLRTGAFYSGWNCTLCELGVKIVKGLLDWHVSEDTIAKRLLSICETFHIEDKVVCQGVVVEFKDELLTVIKQTSLSASDTCVLMFGSICSDSAYDPEVDWSVAFPNKSKPKYKPPTPQPSAPKLRILQLSDIHLDFEYAVDSDTGCSEPLCCRATNGKPAKPSDGAGYWGDYRKCDIPERTLDSLFNHLAKNEQFDMIYWTGDLPPHDIWKQTRADQVSLLQSLTNKLLKYFPNKPIYSAVGNHESAPVDSFPPPFVTGNRSESWLYNVLAKTWSHWLPKSATKTITYGAFYTTLVKKGFRLVSINTNYCDHMNWWLLLNVTDPAQELKWLIDVLQAAEDHQEKVHIIGHIPPGDSTCYRVWSDNYHKIIVRYANTVTAQFFGHTHYDHFQLFYDPEIKEPVSIGYIAPSVTTFAGDHGINPGYRVYTVDGFHINSTWTVVDHETVIMNLTLANSKNLTSWQPEYSAKSMYNMPNLLPSSWHDLTLNMHNNITTFKQFYNHYYKLNPPTTCNAACKDSMICALNMATYGDRSHCNSGIKSSVEDMDKHQKSLKAC